MSIKIQFTRNGRPTGDAFETLSSFNDVHFKFERGKEAPSFRYTKDGKPVGEEHKAPDDAVDVGIEFAVDEDGNVSLRDAHWTDKDGNAIGGADGYIPPPKGGANDWHLEVPGGKLTKAHWTKNGHKPAGRGVDIDVPANANDVHVLPAANEIRSVGFQPEDTFATADLNVIGYLVQPQGLGGSPQILGNARYPTLRLRHPAQNDDDTLLRRMEGLESRFVELEQLISGS